MDRDAPDPRQMEVIRHMSAAERYRASRDLYWTLRRHKAAFLRSLHPDWEEERIADEVRRIFLYART